MPKMCIPIMFGLLVALHMGSNSVNASPYLEDGDMLFETSDLEEYEMPPACEGKSFCFEKGDNYPEEMIAEVLKDMRDLIVNYPEATSIGDREKRESREERSADDGPDCPANTTVALHMGSNSVNASPYLEDGDMLFETSDLEEYEMPPACEGKSFCFEKGDNYPEEMIAEVLKDMRDLIVNYPEATSIGDREKRESREERSADDGPDCPANTTSNPIYYIVDNNDKVRVVVQSPEKFMQIYTVTWCLNEGRITSDTPHFNRYFYTRFAIECVTSKMDFDFFVLSDEVDPNTNKHNMEVARPKGGIPVCCKCRYNPKE